MARRRRSSPPNIHESFSDIALLMLATFIFLLVTILITSKLANEFQLPALKKQVDELISKVKEEEARNARLKKNLERMSMNSSEAEMTNAISSAGLGEGFGKHDFDLFVQGLKNLPGKNLHIVVDATGSMHGITDFLIPVLRVIAIRSNKHLDAITWFSDNKAATYQGSMGEMFDMLMTGAPFLGNEETIGKAFKVAAESAPAPGAYLLIGDEPSTDRIRYLEIPAPVFTLPIGKANPETTHEYKTLAEKTHGQMLRLVFH